MRRLLVALALLAGFAGRAHADTIQDIVVEDNTKTTSATVEFIAQVSVGDTWSPDLVDQIQQRLVTSGLFKDVNVFWDPLPGGVRLHIQVHDKHSWVVAPTFYNQPTNVGGGIGYGENNLFGKNQKLLLYGQVATGDSFFVAAWVIPSIHGTRFFAQPDLYLDTGRNFEYAEPTKWIDNPKPVRVSRLNYLNAGFRIGVEPFHGLKLSTRLRGAYVSYSGVRLADGATTADVLGPGAAPNAPIPKPGKEGWDVSNEWSLTLEKLANWYGVQAGHSYTVGYEYSVPGLSDFHYHRYFMQTKNAWKVLSRHNLVVKTHLTIGHDLPFQQEALMGGTTMRGFVNNQFRGDFQALVNVEYSLPLFEIAGLGVRGLGFWDSGYTTFLTTSNPERNYLPDSEVRGLAGFKNSVGVGTRFYLRQIVIPLLGVDFGYGLEARDFQVYLAVGLTD